MAYSMLRVFLAKCECTATIALRFWSVNYKDIHVKQDLFFFFSPVGADNVS